MSLKTLDVTIGWTDRIRGSRSVGRSSEAGDQWSSGQQQTVVKPWQHSIDFLLSAEAVAVLAHSGNTLMRRQDGRTFGVVQQIGHSRTPYSISPRHGSRPIATIIFVVDFRRFSAWRRRVGVLRRTNTFLLVRFFV